MARNQFSIREVKETNTKQNPIIMKKTKSRLQSSLFLWSLILSVSVLTDLKAQDQVTLNNNSGNPIGLLVDGKLNGSLRAHKARQLPR